MEREKREWSEGRSGKEARKIDRDDGREDMRLKKERGTAEKWSDTRARNV